MKKRTFLALGGAAMAAPGQLVWAQPAFPDRPIRLVVPFAPGGDGDIIARAWAKYVTTLTGAVIVVDNKAGAGGAIGAAEVARARPDGYTLLLGTSTTQIIHPAASTSAAYDPIKDFALVSMLSINPTCVIVNPKVPATNLKELVALAKANPGRYSYGSAGAGTITNLTGELLKYQGNVDMQHVPYKGGGPAMQDLIAEHVQVITTIMSSAVLAQHRAGKARILSVNGDTRLKAAPEIPTSAEAGMPDMRVQVFNAVFAPAATPPRVMTYLRAVNQRVMTDPTFAQEVERAGAELFTKPNPERFFLQEVARWNRIIKTIGFKIES